MMANVGSQDALLQVAAGTTRNVTEAIQFIEPPAPIC